MAEHNNNHRQPRGNFPLKVAVSILTLFCDPSANLSVQILHIPNSDAQSPLPTPPIPRSHIPHHISRNSSYLLPLLCPPAPRQPLLPLRFPCTPPLRRSPHSEILHPLPLLGLSPALRLFLRPPRKRAAVPSFPHTSNDGVLHRVCRH